MVHFVTRRAGAALLAVLAIAAVPADAQNAEPIRVGFSMALTGPLAANGKQALLGAQIWQEEINAKGGLLGRKVELIVYDDHPARRRPRASTPSCWTWTRWTCSSRPTRRCPPRP